MDITIVWMFSTGPVPIIIGVYCGKVQEYTQDEELMALARMFGVYFTSGKLGKTMFNRDTMGEFTAMLEELSDGLVKKEMRK